MSENPMRKISIEKLTINVGVGEPGDKLEKAKKLIERLTKTKAVITNAKKKIPGFKIRPGLPIGIKVTIRKNTGELLKRLLEAVENTVKASSFNGRNLSFGVDEYIHIPGMDYDPSIGIIGLEVTMTAKSYTKVLKQLENKKVKSALFIKHNKPKARSTGKGKNPCTNCGRRGAHISSYGIHVCRQCFRELARDLGFKKLGS
jgi:large subunit ribosomal protein L5